MLKIKNSDVYRPLIVSCKSDISQYEATVEFINGDSRLDSRRIPSFIVMPIELCVMGVIAISWAINQIVFRKANANIHNLVSCDLILGIICIALNYGILWSDSIRDDKTSLNLLYNLTVMGFEVCVYSTLVLAARGWCIIQKKLSASEKTEVMAYSLVLFCFKAMYMAITSSVMQIILFSITSSMMLTLWVSMVNGIRTVDKQIMAHMMVIFKAGIDPCSTPVYYKHLIYTMMVHITVIYFSGCIVIMAMDLANAMDIWVKDMLTWVLNAGMLSAVGFLFRSRKEDCTGYVRFEGMDSEEIHGEIDTSFMTPTNRQSLVRWETGMMLPPPPNIDIEEEETEEDL